MLGVLGLRNLDWGKMMKTKMLMSAIVALSVSATPALAAGVVNPAASLSVANSVRAAAPSRHGNKALGGAAIVGLVIAAAVIAIPVVSAVNDDDDNDNSDSN